MPLEYYFTCPLPAGLHARPATQLSRIASRYSASIELCNERTGAIADCRSILGLVSAAVLLDDRCRLSFSGLDAAAARAGIAEFIERDLLRSDEPITASKGRPASTLAPLLAQLDPQWQAGVPLSSGLALGRLVSATAARLPERLPDAGPVVQAAEQERLDAAVAAEAGELAAQAQHADDPTERDLLVATLAMLRDPQLRAVQQAALAGGASAGQAVLDSTRHFARGLASSSSAYLRERQADVADLGLRLLERLGVLPAALPVPRLEAESIVCASSLSPAQLLAMDRQLLRGLVLEDAASTSHTVILARAWGLPVLGAVAGLSALPYGSRAAIDARAGLLVAPLSPECEEYFTLEMTAQQQRAGRLRELAMAPARTRDGRRIEVAANISEAAEAGDAVANGAEGIGLFRTEMLYASRDEAPGEDEQFEIYAEALRALGGRPLTIRSFDVGGDKPLPYLQLPAETNPFLGYRGVRMYDAQPGLLDAQLRAVCRASALGPVRLMAPMVSGVDEARRFHHRVIDAQLALRSAGIAFDERMPVGVMIEVPSAALAVNQLATVCDFFSIGSNDLSQYFFAADRSNPKVSGLNNERHPAFLRLLKLVCDEARLQDRPVAICGEMARNPQNVPLLLGLGADELSLSAAAIPAVKAALAAADGRECRQLLERAVGCSSPAEVDSLLDNLATAAATPLCSEELLLDNAPGQTKAQVLRSLARLLYASGRSDDPDALEAALCAREAEYSTGLGHGMAIPHCKTAAVRVASLALLRLRQAVDWEALDEQPVDMVIMLTMPRDASGEHLRVFAKLARLLMDMEFRAGLRGAAGAEQLLAMLTTALLPPAG